MNPSHRYAGPEIEKLIESKGRTNVRICLGIDLSKYSKLPEGERKKIVEGVSYNNWFRRDGAVDFFFSFVCDKDPSEEIREIAFRKLTGYGETKSPVQMADND
jgi:hypothetical protein